MTTSSIEAYRYYAEGINLHERFREQEAASLFEKAIAIDPAFAMAYVKLAVVQSNLGNFDLREKYSTLALKFAERLTPRERYYIEGYHYSGRADTLARAIDAYKKCVELDAGHQACRHNLALIYAGLERFAETVTHYEYLVQRGATNATSFGNLSMAYIALGEVGKARSLMDAFSRRNPENAAGQGGVGLVRLAEGQFEEAIQSFERAQLLDPTETNSLVGKVTGQTLRENWPAAREAATGLANGAGATRKWFGAMALSSLALYEGRSGEALTWSERAARAYATPGVRSAQAKESSAAILLARGQAAQAVQHAQSAWQMQGVSVLSAWPWPGWRRRRPPPGWPPMPTRRSPRCRPRPIPWPRTETLVAWPPREPASPWRGVNSPQRSWNSIRHKSS